MQSPLASQSPWNSFGRDISPVAQWGSPSPTIADVNSNHVSAQVRSELLRWAAVVCSSESRKWFQWFQTRECRSGEGAQPKLSKHLCMSLIFDVTRDCNHFAICQYNAVAPGTSKRQITDHWSIWNRFSFLPVAHERKGERIDGRQGAIDDHLTDEGDRLNINWTFVFGTFVREIASIVLIV